jgi:predicted DsbA family dithiol-disulfide isomerase
MQKDYIHIDYFSDVLCIWAYIAQIRIDELISQYADQIKFNQHFIPVFGSTEKRISSQWKEKGGFQGYHDHVMGICAKFDHIEVHPKIWLENIPRSSASCHHFLTSIRLLEKKDLISCEPQEKCRGRTLFEEAIWQVRLHFFRDLQDVADLEVQTKIAREMDLPVDEIIRQMHSGEAMAAMCGDLELRDEYRIAGSPTYVLNEGRQKLYGNVGYKIISANIREILDNPANQASWC